MLKQIKENSILLHINMTESNLKIDITPAALEAAKKALEKRGTLNAHLRLGVKGGGCSGFSNVIQFEDNLPTEKDVIFKFEGLDIIVDKKSLIYLNGLVLDWESTLLAKGFKFNNPNVKSFCGCGTSFQI